MYRVGQPSAALSRCGCCMPLAGEGGVRDCARRRVSERNRRKAALGAEITQEGETGEAPPGADEASLFRGWPPNSGYAVSAVWLGPTVYSRSMRGRKDFFDPLKQLSQTGTARSAGLLFLWGGMGDFTKGKRLFAGFRKISSEVQKSSCIVHRCTVYDLIAKKEAGYRRNVGRSRSGDISCRKKDVSCRRPRKARKICYTEHRKLKNCQGAPPDP